MPEPVHFDASSLAALRNRFAQIVGVEPSKIDVSVGDQLLLLEARDAFRLLVLYEAAVAMAATGLDVALQAVRPDDPCTCGHERARHADGGPCAGCPQECERFTLQAWS